MSELPELDHKAILETLKYTTADGFRRLQTTLTKTANSIEKDAVKGRLGLLFTEEEKQTLEQAAALLRQVKGRVEHAKEIKAREERRREKLMQARDQKVRSIAKKNLPTSARELITLTLFLKLHHQDYSRFGMFYCLYDDPEFILNKMRDESRSFKEIANTITGDLTDWLVNENVLSRSLDEEPDENIMVSILKDCETSYDRIRSRFSAVFEAMDRREAMQSATNVTRLNPRKRSIR
ncbi:hypothetical protein EZI54_07000 [Marinobacter halodurans]|uniref:Uncharacterized protein n=1 Tax=Marinobacter halodurans TaxID=2528979 RepID=A0ABY1ZPA9_9GAMM|nr:hypothetical protein [Marinobacter halodurans]TBW57398.1 hypothetical protein EZI54_07000 [Marinobacter halodurans]